MHLTIGTRASKLAMIQTQWIVQCLQKQWPNLEITIEQIHTTGDRVRDVPLTKIGGDGVFVTEIEHSLQKRHIDLAVHSLKDLPTIQPEGLRIIVSGPREDVRDVFISRKPFHVDYSLINEKSADVSNGRNRIGSLRSDKSGDATNFSFINHKSPRLIKSDAQDESPWRIGTCSLRRTAQISTLCPDAQILPLRGNVDTRLRKLDAGEYDGIILASAGLHRMGLPEEAPERYITYFPIDLMMPAPGQGALALECRDEPEMLALLAPLQDLTVQAATTAERMFMRHLGAGCYLPVAAYGELLNGLLTLKGLIISLDGQQRISVQQSISWGTNSSLTDAEHLGISLAEQALQQGANEIIWDLIPAQEHAHV